MTILLGSALASSCSDAAKDSNQEFGGDVAIITGEASDSGQPTATDTGEVNATGAGGMAAEAGAGPEEGADAAATDDAAMVERVDPGCTGEGQALSAGDHAVSISFGGNTRDYILHVPVGLPSAQPVPLVVNFHGYGGDAPGEALWTGMNLVADREKFVIAYPNGFGLARSWNAGACCGEALLNNLDDVGLARAIVADISRQLCINGRRVYATGFSNGGMFSHRIACEAADLFAAVAAVSGQLGIAPDMCSPTRPIPVLHIHGTGDTVAPYNGGLSPAAPGQTFLSVAETIGTWVSKNACTNSTPEEYLRNGTAHCERYAACAAGVTVSLCLLDGEGHCWPGNANCLGFGQATTDLDASEEIWSFFSQAQLP